MNVDKTLKERGNNYGSYGANVEAISTIMDALDGVKVDKDGRRLTTIERTHLQYQVIKLVRLGATPEHVDSWHDIQGYANLSEKYFKGLKNDCTNI